MNDSSPVRPLGAAVPTLLRAVLVPRDDGDEYDRRDVLLDGGKIARVAPAGSLTAPEGCTEMDCSQRLLLPGFVNGHAHSSEHWIRGLVRPLPLELWVLSLIRHEPRGDCGWFGEESFARTPSAALFLSALLSGVEALLSGCTVVQDHIFVRHADDCAAVAAAYRALGVRAFIAPMLTDDAVRYANYIPLCEEAAERNARGCCDTGMGAGGVLREELGGSDPAQTRAMLDLWEACVAKCHEPAEGTHVAIGPVTAYSASVELLKGAADIRRRHGLTGHTHLLETRAQALLARQSLPSGSAVRHLKETGFLDLPGTSCAHAVWLDEEEMRLMAEAGAAVVHNPWSNLRLGSGVMPLHAMEAAGVTVALGCDGAGSSDGQDMLEVVKLTSLIHSISTPEYRTWTRPRHAALDLAARNGYRAVGLGGCGGVLREGYDADVSLWDLTTMSLLPRTDPVGLLVNGSRTQAPGAGSALNAVWVRGVQVVADSSPVGVDLPELRRQLMEAQPEYRSPAVTAPESAPITAAAEVEYRAALGLSPPPRELEASEVGVTPGRGSFPAGRSLYDPKLHERSDGPTASKAPPRR